MDIQSYIDNKKNLYDNIIAVDNIDDIVDIFENKTCFISLDKNLWKDEKLEKIMSKYSLSYRCIPFELENKVIIAKSY